MMTKEEAADVLTDARDRIIEALEDARNALEDAAPEEWNWAEAYWWSHMRTALDEDHDYVGGAGQTMQTTIDALKKKVED
jgi:hypothetical protein